MMRPTIVIQDPNLVRLVLCDEFEHFRDRNFLHKDCDLNNLLPIMQGNQWKSVKQTMHGMMKESRIKEMYPLISKSSESLAKYCQDVLFEHRNLTGSDIVEISCTELTVKYVIEMSSSLAFGKDLNLSKAEDITFVTMAKRAAVFGHLFYFKYACWLIAPWFMKLFKIKGLNQKAFEYLLKSVSNEVNSREDVESYREDMCQNIFQIKQEIADAEEAKLNYSKHLSNHEFEKLILAQSVSLISGGIDALASVLHLFLYELTKNKEIQRKLIHEIDNMTKQHGTCLSYNLVERMTYLDMVVSEHLRFWPQTFPMIMRQCNREIELPPPRTGGKPYKIYEGDMVWISKRAIHFSEKFWPNAGTFDPNRFSNENRVNIVPYSYLPFGLGPRNCLGNRLVKATLKSSIIHLLSKFEFVRTPNFNDNLQYRKDCLTLRPQEFLLAFKERIGHVQ